MRCSTFLSIWRAKHAPIMHNWGASLGEDLIMFSWRSTEHFSHKYSELKVCERTSRWVDLKFSIAISSVLPSWSSHLHHINSFPVFNWLFTGEISWCCIESNFKSAHRNARIRYLWALKSSWIKTYFSLLDNPSRVALHGRHHRIASINHVKLNNQIEFKICARAIMLMISLLWPLIIHDKNQKSRIKSL